MTSALSAQHLQVRRGGFLLDIPHVSVQPGSVVGLVGHNGSGKTTLLSTLVGLIRPHAGEIRVAGLDPVVHPLEVRQRVCRMTDDEPLFDLPIRQLISLIAPLYPTWDVELAAALLDRLQLDPRRLPASLSKGENTRLRLVLALAWKPVVVLLDEPGTGLDVKQRRALLREVLEVVRDPARTVVFSSHQVDDVERVADQVILLDGGRLAAFGPTESVVPPGRTLEQILVEMP